jgi:hypothetical protein
MKMVSWGVTLCLIIEVRRETQKIAAAAAAADSFETSVLTPTCSAADARRPPFS